MKRKPVFPLLLVLAVAGLLSFTTARPRLFVIGDSISIFYGPYLKKYVEGKFDYDRKRDKGEAMKNLDNPVGANGGRLAHGAQLPEGTVVRPFVQGRRAAAELWPCTM